LFFGEQARVSGSSGTAILNLVMRLIVLEDIIQTPRFPSLLLSLEEGMYEASGVRMLLRLLTGQAWGIKGGFTAMVILLVEDDLLVPFQ